MRINNSGTYEYCRWMSKKANITRVNFDNNIQTVQPLLYFQNGMSEIRNQLLNGETLPGCCDCIEMEQHGKVSGRQKQLLKVGITLDHFDRGLLSSTLRDDFTYSNLNQGQTMRTVSDWQIDLGNYCNSACIFCNPESSSRLATEFQNLGLVDTVPPPSWCDDPELLEKFINTLKSSDNLQYLHFLGGETVITPGFKQILTALVEADLAKDITIGFTTNLTVWSETINQLLVQFKQVNLGMSIETLTPINDYVRWPSKLDKTLELLDRWRELGEQNTWLMQLRITPTCLTVHEFTTVYDYAWQHGMAVESCNFLHNPAFLRIGVLPKVEQKHARNRLADWIINHPIDIQEQIINVRDPSKAHPQIRQDAISYLNYLDTVTDESHRLSELTVYLKKLEKNRGNSILTYLPEYENLFRTSGY